MTSTGNVNSMDEPGGPETFRVSQAGRHAGTRGGADVPDASDALGASDAPDAQYERCLAALDRCAAACATCYSSCIAEGHLPQMEKCIRLDLDCEAFCRMTAAALARQTQFARDFCNLCARLCDACADECGRHDATHCEACADACRACAEACRAL